MKWVVDTCVVIDILCGDGQFSALSADTLDARRDEGLCIAPATYIELAPSFGGNAAEQDTVLADLGIAVDFGGDRTAVLEAHKAWNAHVLRRRTEGIRKRPIADVMIGAFALRTGGLITRNESDFRTLYPSLPILNPATPQSPAP